MMDYTNPFEYEAANRFTSEQILDFYIEDYNYSRFIRSRRNILLVGERGTGKTMTLLYNSFPVQQKRAEREGTKLDFDLVYVYVPCNTPLTHKGEYQLLEDFSASLVSEHFFVLSIMYAIADTLGAIPNLLDDIDEEELRDDIEFILDIQIPEGRPIFEGLKLAFNREVTQAQKAINAKTKDAFYENAISFSAGVMALVTRLKKAPKLSESHFVLMIDDAHDLNLHQIKALNSWIAFRDNTVFSFKVATAKVDQPSLVTSSGGTILEGHDYTVVDMELPYQNRYSDFGKLSRRIVKRRLEKTGVTKEPDDFFPVDPQFSGDLKECQKLVREEAERKFPHGTPKQVADYVYKYTRAKYYQSRPPKANRPSYSGFDILVHISTGVIRNLLEPCFWMYDKVVSEHDQAEEHPMIDEIKPSIQSEVILNRSKRKWEWIRDGLDRSIEGCSREQAEQLYQLFDNLAILFRARLLHHKSEPRAIAFTVSDVDYIHYPKLRALLGIARKAQIIYTYTSSAKDYGKREIYYVPNRILWPERGLDPHGQHARVSLKARDLWVAASENRQISSGDSAKEIPAQQGLFND